MQKRPPPEKKREFVFGKLPSGGSVADRTKTFMSMPKPDLRKGKPHVRVFLADGVLGDLDIETALVEMIFREGDDESWTARIVATPNGVKIRQPAYGRNRIDVAVSKGLSVAIPNKRAELRLIEHVDGLPVFAVPPGVSIAIEDDLETLDRPPKLPPPSAGEQPG